MTNHSAVFQASFHAHHHAETDSVKVLNEVHRNAEGEKSHSADFIEPHLTNLSLT